MSQVGQTSPRSPPRLCQLPPQKKSPVSRPLQLEAQRQPSVRAPQKENRPAKGLSFMTTILCSYFQSISAKAISKSVIIPNMGKNKPKS
jgi:hypothetical protein